METTPILEEKIIYSVEDTPWYFGAYLNQARHNLFIVLNELSIKCGTGHIVNDDGLLGADIINKLNNPAKYAIIYSKAIGYLEQHLPFLKIIANGKTGNQWSTALVDIINVLNELRNTYSHYKEVDTAIKNRNEELLNVQLQQVLHSNIDTVKKRFNLTDDDVAHLKESKYYKFEGEQLSSSGLYFFICQLLTRGQAQQFLKKISGYKRDDLAYFKATIEAYCVSSIKLPTSRITSDNSQQALLLDICNELTKCPDELYRVLSAEDKKQFHVLLEAREAEDEESETEVRLVRKNNRFTFLAQRCIEEQNLMKEHAFGIDLGTYFFSNYPKSIAEVEETRRLTKQLIGIGKLTDFDADKRPENFKLLFNDPDNESLDPYIRETYPSYKVDNNVIPLYKCDNSAKWPVVDLEATTGKSYPYKLAAKTQNTPVALLSATELPAMLFYAHISNNTAGKTIDLVITKHISKCKKLYKDMQAGMVKPIKEGLQKDEYELDKTHYNKEIELLLNKYELKYYQVPERVLHALLGLQQTEADDMMRREERLNEMIADTEQKIKHVEKLLKYANTDKIKVGELAEDLASDMMLMQPVAHDEKTGKPLPASKANSTAYRLLQSKLAYFNEHKRALRRIFTACKLLFNKNKHPFLDKVSKPEDCKALTEYYIKYYEKKLCYLNNALDNETYDLHFLSRRPNNTNIKALGTIYLDAEKHPILLPKGLFFEACLKDFSTQPVIAAYLQAHGTCKNIVHLVNYYMQQLQEEEQNYYNLKRGYKLFAPQEGEMPYYTKAELETAYKRMSHKVKDKNKGYKTTFIENETQLRWTAMQDKVLYLHITQQLSSLFGVRMHSSAAYNADGFRLSNFSPTAVNGKSILECNPVENVILQYTYYKSGITGNVTKEKIGVAHIYDNRIKVKNIGNFRKLLKDRRLNNLMQLLHTEKPLYINRYVLENELQTFEVNRNNVLRSVYAFEKKLYGYLTAKGVNVDFGKHREVMKAYKNYFEVTDIDADILVAIRNGFSHNQYPAFTKEEELEKFKLKEEAILMLHHTYETDAKSSHLNYGRAIAIAEHAATMYNQLTEQIK